MLNPQLFAMQNISEVKTILLARFKSVYVLRKDNPGNIQPTSVFPENYPQAVLRLFWLSHTDSIMLRSGICEWPLLQGSLFLLWLKMFFCDSGYMLGFVVMLQHKHWADRSAPPPQGWYILCRKQKTPKY